MLFNVKVLVWFILNLFFFIVVGDFLFVFELFNFFVIFVDEDCFFILVILVFFFFGECNCVLILVNFSEFCCVEFEYDLVFVCFVFLLGLVKLRNC